jgi:transcriptional regulator of acetoin/glycerol metabolism
MATAPAHPPGLAGGERLAVNRERFLTSEAVEPHQVREPILASWRRSQHGKVPADHIDLAYIRSPDLDTPLTRSALPVLRHLREQLDGQPISVILTDPAGLVLTRLRADYALDRHLESVQLAPGFSYAEDSVGTNGIGTALESGRPMHVFGHEHYAEHLEDLACAGAPIHDPLTGKTVGAVDLTCWRKDAGPLLITLAKVTADQIRQSMLADSSADEVELLQEYLRTCRRGTGIVLALDDDVVMMNEHARQTLDRPDQSALLEQAGQALSSGQQGTVPLELPSGISVRMHCKPVPGAGGAHGGVVTVRMTEASPGRPAQAGSPPRVFLPGIVGSGPLWLRACHEVDAVHESGEWLALAGEPGSGKLALLRATCQWRSPAGAFHVLDGADAAEPDWLARARQELTENSGSLVIRDVDRLSPRRLRQLTGALRRARTAGPQQRPWVAVTLTGQQPGGDLAGLLSLFPRTVDCPPLRHHAEDVHELVRLFLARLSTEGRLGCSPEAMQMLVRYSWPGNTQQLWQVIRRIAQHRRTGLILPADLPPECRTVSRRLLSPLESMERDAIVASLHGFEGNKVRAAKALGMSRATIYRKIHEYGIVVAARLASPRRAARNRRVIQIEIAAAKARSKQEITDRAGLGFPGRLPEGAADGSARRKPGGVRSAGRHRAHRFRRPGAGISAPGQDCKQCRDRERRADPLPRSGGARRGGARR